MKNFFEELQIPSDSQKVHLLQTFVQKVYTESLKYNLTGWKTLEEIWRKGVLSSVYWNTICSIFLSGKAVDIGTGAGFPGIPLKILYPELEMTCVESIKKKSHFIREVSKMLELKNFQVITERAEKLAHLPEFREKFDYAFTRALGSLRVLHELSLPFLRIGGSAFHLKGITVFEEVLDSYKSIEILGGRYVLLYSYRIPGSAEREVLVQARKENPTPEKYPRRPGVPFKTPLQN